MSQILSAIERHATQRPSEIAIRSGQVSMNLREVSYQELAQQIERVSNELKQQGGARIGLCLDNSIEWILSDLAAISAGITLIPIPLFFTDSQLQHLIKDAKLDALIVDHQWIPSPLFRTSIAENPEIIDFSVKALSSLNVLLIQLKHADQGLKIESNNLTNIAKVTYTSGSTGDPKGVCLTQATIENVAISLQVAVSPLQIKKHLCIMPLATLLENIAGVYVPLLSGCMVQVESLQALGLRLSSGLNTTQFIHAVETIRPHSLIALPQLLKLLVNIKQKFQVDSGSTSNFNYLRFIAVGGGKTPRKIIQQALHLNLPVFEGYGLSECASVTCLNTPQFNRVGSVGKPLKAGLITIANDGEIIVHNHLMQGYLSSLQSTNTPASIKTGDLGYFDNEGFLYINGRKKNQIISSFGRNISPEWVESELEASPFITQCAVYGEQKPFLTAVIVTPKDISRIELNRIIQQCNQRLPDYAQIKYWIQENTPFSMKNGLLTYNARPKRIAIYKQYRGALEKFYIKQEPANHNEAVSCSS